MSECNDTECYRHPDNRKDKTAPFSCAMLGGTTMCPRPKRQVTYRSPERIPAILSRLQELWEQYPDLRLGQLLANCAHESKTDLFYLEDDELIDAMEYLYGKATFRSMTPGDAKDAVSKAIQKLKDDGYPVACYDAENHRAYLLYPDGHKKYGPWVRHRYENE